MANDFSADPNCIALYRFESDPMAPTSKGTDDLTRAGGVLPEVSIVNFKEGSASARLDASGSEYCYRTDANLTASFPLKSGTSNKTISVAMWVRYFTYPADGTNMNLWGKTAFSGSVSCLGVFATNSGGNQFFFTDLGKTDGTHSENWFHDYHTLVINTWYHLTVGYRDSDKAYRVCVRDASGNTLGSDLSGTALNNIALFASTDFMLGTMGSSGAPESGYFDGYLDEVVVFNKLLTATDATNIAKGLYSGTGEATTVGEMWLH